MKMKVDRKEIFRTVGWLGAAMVTAGYLRYSIQETFTRVNEILLIGGGVLLLAAAAFNFRAILAFFSKRSSKLGTNTAVLTIGVVAILSLLNFLGYRHHKRFDWTTEKLYTLSDQTQKIGGSLTKDVRVILFAKGSTPDNGLSDRMAEYKNLSRHIQYEVVDPQEHPELAKQYNVARMGQVIVTSGVKTEHLEETQEQDITSAILKVTREGEKTVCFVEGHDEKSITASDAHGYSNVATELGKENYQTKSVNLVASNGVPSDCSVLVEAGPTKGLFPQEVDMIKKYLEANGKALILDDPQTDPKLDGVFQEWNMKVGDDIVIDASGVGRMFGTGPAVPLVVDYGTSPITRNFERTMTFFPLARTVAIADRNKMLVNGTELLKTSAQSFAAKEIVNNQVKFDPAKDQRGPLSLGVAAERKEEGKGARLVVIGDSDFATNQWVGLQRNGDLFYNTINWLSEEEALISIRPKSPENRRVNLTEAQQKGLMWFSLALLPGVVILSGVYIWWKRR
jgi:ABC-type uncharacterized transport system involved in gliding motility auxiliary subunit